MTVWTTQRLDAAARGVDEVRSHAQRPRSPCGSNQLAGGHHTNAPPESGFEQRVHHSRRDLRDRQAHGSASACGAALASVDDQKIRRRFRTPLQDRIPQVVDELPSPDRGFHPHRATGQVAHQRHLVEQVVDVATSWCRFGLIESFPARMPRSCAIAAVILAPDRTPPSFLASRYTEPRVARLNGISSRSSAKKYWRKYSPGFSKRIAQPADGRVIAQDGMFLLRDVLHEPEHHQSDQDQGKYCSDPVRAHTHYARYQRLPR